MIDVSTLGLAIIMGVLGGIAGYLVDNKHGYKLLLAAGFVGGFSALVFPPLIVFGVELHTDILVNESVSGALSGFIGAVSWHLIMAIKEAIPSIIKRRFKSDN